MLAISTWIESLPLARCRLELRGDAQGVLQAILARRGKCATINRIIAEIQLLLGESMYDIYAAHVWSEDNDRADKLSRVPEGAAIPRDCSKVVFSPVVRRPWTFL